MTRRRIIAISLACVAVLAWPASAQIIDQSRGVDPEVDYESLTRFGPWDDRNYELTRADLDLLAPNEEELKDPIPTFFRIVLRKEWPTLPREGPTQYPRSALQIFRQKFGGYLINGKTYTAAKFKDGRWVVVDDEGREIEGSEQPGDTGENETSENQQRDKTDDELS